MGQCGCGTNSNELVCFISDHGAGRLFIGFSPIKSQIGAHPDITFVRGFKSHGLPKGETTAELIR